MNKRTLYFTIGIAVFLILGVSAFALYARNLLPKRHDATTQEQQTTQQEETTVPSQKALITYFSVTGNTAKIAEYIQNLTGDQIVEIVPAEAYTDADLDYTQDNSRANQEQNSATARPEMKNPIDVSDYDTIYVGYPIWWNDVPRIVLTFLDSQDFTGKTVIPFCTSGGSGISGSLNTLKSTYPDLNWGNGECFSASSTEADVADWLKP